MGRGTWCLSPLFCRSVKDHERSWYKEIMNNKLHLAVIHPAREGEHPIRNVELFNEACHDFVLNHDFTAFRPQELLWRDDDSYGDYQASDSEGGDECPETVDAPLPPSIPPTLRSGEAVTLCPTMDQL